MRARRLGILVAAALIGSCGGDDGSDGDGAEREPAGGGRNAPQRVEMSEFGSPLPRFVSTAATASWR